MSLKTASLVAFAAMLVWSIVQLFNFIRIVITAAEGVVPIITVITTLVSTAAIICLTIFLAVFHRNQN